MQHDTYRLTRSAAFLTSAATAVGACLSPILFTAFHSTYGISYTMLGFLVVLNFSAQLTLDLIYSFFSDRLNLALSVKLTPFVMFFGILLYAAGPVLFPGNIYLGLALGTVVFSAGSGLAEVLTSPLIAAIPSDNPERMMSKLHSCYAWGVVAVVCVCTVFLSIFSAANWQALALVLSLLPLAAFLLIVRAPMPPLTAEGEQSGKQSGSPFKNKIAILYILCIFFAGASEITMCQWSSSYLETAFAIDKTLCDLLGLALFGAALGLGRSLYTKFGRGIDRILLLGSLGAAACYLTVALCDLPILGLAACALTGFFVSMLWPGSLIAVTDRIPEAGVTLFALMAVGGDLGATVYPQAIGLITDAVIASDRLVALGSRMGLSPTQTGLRAGMLFAMLAPLIGAVLFAIAMRTKKNR